MTKSSKQMTKREKILLIVFIVFMVVIGWYKLVYEPINNKIDTINSNAEAEQTEIDASIVTVAKLNKMEKALTEYKAEGAEPIMPTADNSKELLVKLNKVMKLANEYAIDFGDPKQDDYLISREVKLSYITDTYDEARKIIDKLDAETYINQISDVNMEMITEGDSSRVEVELMITYFEVA